MPPDPYPRTRHTRLYTCCAACAHAIAALEDLVLVERNGVEQAVLGNVVN